MPEYIISPKLGSDVPIIKRYRGRPYRDAEGVMKVYAKTRDGALGIYHRAKTVSSASTPIKMVSSDTQFIPVETKNENAREDLLIEGIKVGAEI